MVILSFFIFFCEGKKTKWAKFHKELMIFPFAEKLSVWFCAQIQYRLVYLMQLMWLVMSVGETVLILAREHRQHPTRRSWPSAALFVSVVLSSLFSVSRSSEEAPGGGLGGGRVQNRHFGSGLSQEVPHTDGTMSSQRASQRHVWGPSRSSSAL